MNFKWCHLELKGQIVLKEIPNVGRNLPTALDELADL